VTISSSFQLQYFVLGTRCRVRSWGSSVSIVSDYWLGDRGLIPGRGRGIFASLCVETGSRAHPAPCTMGTGGPFTEIKRGQGVTLTTQPHLVPSSRRVGAILPLPPGASTTWSGTAFTRCRVSCSPNERHRCSSVAVGREVRCSLSRIQKTERPLIVSIDEL
jgi:hypothetical protein